jgi:protein bicaudal C
METGCHIHFPDSNRDPEKPKSNQVSIAGFLASVEKARSSIRALAPIAVTIDLRHWNNEANILLNHPLLNEISNHYEVAVLVRENRSTNLPFMIVKANVFQENELILAVRELERRVLAAPSASVCLAMDILQPEQACVLGPDRSNIQTVMNRTGVHILYPRGDDATSTTFYLQGSVEAVLQARKHILGLLPVTVSFEIPDHLPAPTPSAVSEMEAELRISISIRPKRRQDGSCCHAVLVEGEERHLSSMYAVRTRLCNDGQSISCREYGFMNNFDQFRTKHTAASLIQEQIERLKNFQLESISPEHSLFYEQPQQQTNYIPLCNVVVPPPQQPDCPTPLATPQITGAFPLLSNAVLDSAGSAGLLGRTGSSLDVVSGLGGSTFDFPGSRSRHLSDDTAAARGAKGGHCAAGGPKRVHHASETATGTPVACIQPTQISRSVASMTRPITTTTGRDRKDLITTSATTLAGSLNVSSSAPKRTTGGRKEPPPPLQNIVSTHLAEDSDCGRKMSSIAGHNGSVAGSSGSPATCGDPSAMIPNGANSLSSGQRLGRPNGLALPAATVSDALQQHGSSPGPVTPVATRFPLLTDNPPLVIQPNAYHDPDPSQNPIASGILQSAVSIQNKEQAISLRKVVGSGRDTERAKESERELNEYQTMAVKASKAITEEPTGALRCPNSQFVGYGFSKSMPESALRAFIGCLRAQESHNGNGAAIPGGEMGTIMEDVEEEPQELIQPQTVRRRPRIDFSASNVFESLTRPANESGGFVFDLARDDISVLLSVFNLQQHEETFRQEEIDLEILLTINEEDLKEMGIRSIGARRKLGLAIQKINKAKDVGATLVRLT